MSVKCQKCNSENSDTQSFCGECGASLASHNTPPEVTQTLKTSSEDLTRGSLFAGRYEIIEELGRGGMGKVYRVEDTKIKQEVALKLIKSEIASQKKTIDRFRNELKVAREISHRNVCRMYDLGEDKGTLFITMEYVRGEDLKSFIKRSKQLSISTAMDIASQVCDGLTEAHRLGIVHRDLKPNNIMIDNEGNVRIMDFGIARFLKDKGLTSAGLMIGTPVYMSPEQAEAAEVDHRSDIYSLGVILYEMVTGRVPFEGDTPLSIAMKHKGELPKNPRDYNEQIPVELSLLILKCLDKNRENRYQSAKEVGLELKSIDKNISTAGRESYQRKSLLSKKKIVTPGSKKIFIPALALAVFLAAVIAVWQFVLKKDRVPEKSGQSSIAVLNFEDLSAQKDQGHLCVAFSEAINNALSSIANLRVLAPDSSYLFKRGEMGSQELGEKLSVRNLLRGSLQIAGEKIRVTAQPIDASDNSVIWSDQWNGELKDIFAFQDKISWAVVNKLKLRLMGSDKVDIQKRHTEDIEAFTLYAQGLFYWNRRTSESLEKAIDYFKQAVNKDQNYALAFAGLADCYNLQSFYCGYPPSDTFPNAKEAALKALSLDERLAEAHNSIAYVKSRYDWDWEGAEQEYKRALELNPNYAIGHMWYSEFLNQQCRSEEAIREINKALELDPVSLIINSIMGFIYMQDGQLNQAHQIMQNTIEMDPNFAHTHAVLGYIYLSMNRFSDAIREIETAIELSANVSLYKSYLGLSFARAGNSDEAQKIIDELIKLSENRYVAPYNIASIYIGLGEIDKAFEFFELAYEKQDELLPLIKRDPRTDSIKEDPRYFNLLQRLGMD